jgi:hypothetical protein
MRFSSLLTNTSAISIIHGPARNAMVECRMPMRNNKESHNFNRALLGYVPFELA